MSGEANLKTSQKDRGKGLLTSEGWGSNGCDPNFTPLLTLLWSLTHLLLLQFQVARV